MRRITRVTVEREDGTTETWKGGGTVHEHFTGQKADRVHTSSYIEVILVPDKWDRKPTEVVQLPAEPEDTVETIVSHTEGIGDA